MKHRNTTPLVALLVIAIMSIVGVAIAGQVYGRASTALAATTGNGTWTNTQQYAGVVLKRIWIESCLAAANTVTVTRTATIGGVAYSQAVGTVGFASGNGSSTATFTAAHLAPGDILHFTSAVSTGSTAVIEFEVQQH